MTRSRSEAQPRSRVSASGTAPLGYQWQRNSVDIPGATAPSYTLASAQLGDNGALFRCVVTNAFGQRHQQRGAPHASPRTSRRRPSSTCRVPGTLYSAGDTIDYAGTATDPEDGTLPGERLHVADRLSPRRAHAPVPRRRRTGATGGSVLIPTSGETAANVLYRIHLSVRDSAGNTHATFRDVLPRTATLRIETIPAGLEVLLDGQPAPAPLTFPGVAGILRELEAPSPQVVSGTTWVFESWSDGGARAHTVSTPLVDTTYTATYRAAAVTGEAVVWTRTRGVQASGNDLTMTAPRGWGNAGAVSSKVLAAGDGFFELTASETSRARMIGFSSSDFDQSWRTLDFALYLSPLGDLAVYERGLYRGSVGSYATNDVLRVAVESGVVSYWNGGVLLYTSLEVPSFPLAVDTALYDPGATLTGVVVSGGWTLPPPPNPVGTPVVWTPAPGLAVSGNDITKTAPTASVNVGTVSAQSLAAGDGSVAFTVSETNTARMLGLSRPDSRPELADPRLRLLPAGRPAAGHLRTRRLPRLLRHVFPGRRAAVDLESGVVRYRKNGGVLHTSAAAPSFPLVVEAWLHTTGATLTGVVVSGGFGPLTEARMASVRLDDKALGRARGHLAACDPVMARLVREIGPVPMRAHRGGSAFAYLSRAILAQQISTAAARSIGNRISERFGWPWRPEQFLQVERRRAAGARPVAAEGRLPARPGGAHAERPAARPPEPDVRGPRDRDADGGEGHRPLDRRDVPHVPARPRRRAARGRPRDPVRDAPRLRPARSSEEGTHAPDRRSVATLPLDRVLLPVGEPRLGQGEGNGASQEPLTPGRQPAFTILDFSQRSRLASLPKLHFNNPRSPSCSIAGDWPFCSHC